MYPLGRTLVLQVVVRALSGEQFAARVQQIEALFQRPQDYLEAPALRQLPNPFPYTKRARVRADRHTLDAIIDAAVSFLVN